MKLIGLYGSGWNLGRGWRWWRRQKVSKRLVAAAVEQESVVPNPNANRPSNAEGKANRNGNNGKNDDGFDEDEDELIRSRCPRDEGAQPRGRQAKRAEDKQVRNNQRDCRHDYGRNWKNDAQESVEQEAAFFSRDMQPCLLPCGSR